LRNDDGCRCVGQAWDPAQHFVAVDALSPSAAHSSCSPWAEPLTAPPCGTHVPQPRFAAHQATTAEPRQPHLHYCA
jgi:hypothetical protein